MTAAFRRSFFSDPDGIRLASARAGNVIGGGDWAQDRLVPDIMRAALSGTPVRIRNPNAVRPWQHVVNPLAGYLLLAQTMWEQPEMARSWNFGPQEDDAHSVGWLLEHMAGLWPGLEWEFDDGPHPHEAGYLKLDSSRARTLLGWRPILEGEAGLQATVDWFRELQGGADMRRVTASQIEAYQLASSAR